MGVVASMLPDADVLAFRLHIAYADDLGHRGASHSLFIALLLGMLGALLAPSLGLPRFKAFAFTAGAAASHGLLDMLTRAGLGVALWWPWSSERHFFPCHVIEASPLSLRRVFGPAGWAVLQSELLWVWLPALCAAVAVRQVMRRGLRSDGPEPWAG